MTDPVESARVAGLRYVSIGGEGIGRRRTGRGFAYTDPRGARVADPDALARIRALAIPPAWREVWICPSPQGHVQAVGRDARGRKQYRYHPRWRAVRDETKYARLAGFGRALPRIRDRVLRDLARPGLPREKVLATVVRLLETTLIRVGNAEYARANRSFGLTTLRNRHADVSGATVRFGFRAKSGKSHVVDVRDRRLAAIVRRCQELPGQELFQYVDAAGQRQTIDSADVNAYLQEISGADFTAKDFRTWAGTVLAALALRDLPALRSRAHARRNVLRAIEQVAGALGNTPAVCRRSYVHPAVIAAYHEGTRVGARRGPRSLTADEAAVLSLLERRPPRAIETPARRAA